MADPRGGELRRATIVRRDTWRAEEHKSEVVGWVKPNKTIVTFEGLSYPTLAIGERVTLDQVLNPPPPPPGVFRDFSFMEREKLLLPALLLIAGHVKAAESKFPQDLEKTPGRTFINTCGSYLVPRFHRAVHAHMAGDAKNALADAEILAATMDAYEAEAVRRMGREMVDRLYESTLQTGPVIRVFQYLSPVPKLREDSARRVREKASSKPDVKGIEKLPAEQRIAKLIEWLDEVDARQWGQPGGVSIPGDPISLALAQEGEKAIEPLLSVIESDKRLTRAVSFGRDFFANRNLISVAQAAYAIVGNILQLSLVSKDPYRPYSVEELRGFWNANKGKSRAERLLEILRDDAGNWRQWQEAASQIVRPNDIRVTGEWIGIPDAKPGQEPPIVGEELRSKSNPTVSEILSKRALQVAGTGELTSSTGYFEVAEAQRIGISFAIWDLKASLPTLAKLSQRAIEVTDSDRGGNAIASIFEPAALVIGHRIRGGDETAWNDYEKLLGNFKPDSFFSALLFSPLWEKAAHHRARTIAKNVLLDRQSTFMQAVLKNGSVHHSFTELIASPLLKVDEFRTSLKQLLANKTVVGFAIRDQNGYRYKIAEQGGSGSRGLKFPSADPSKIGDDADYRVCDQIAIIVSTLKGAPFYNPVLPDAQRDKVLTELATYLDSIAHRVEDILPDHSRYLSRRY